jgi:hypothetical protein
MILPVQHALQGHPEESCTVFEKHITSGITKYGFLCGTYKGHLMRTCHQVDNLAIGCANASAVSELINSICTEDKIDLRHEGSLNSFNGVYVDQPRDYVKVHYETYSYKMLTQHHGCATPGSKELSTKPIKPLQSNVVGKL